METFLTTMVVGGACTLIIAGVAGSGGAGIFAAILIGAGVVLSTATGKGSSFGPNATHDNRYPYRRKRGK